MYRAQAALGASFTEDGGWKVATAYTSPAEEVRGARDGVGLADVSAGGRLGVKGEAVDALLAKVAGCDCPPGRAAHVRLNGAETLACRLATDEVLLLTRAAEAAAVTELLEKASAASACAHVTDRSSACAALEVVGPGVPRLLSRLVPLDLSPAAVPPLGVVQGELARVRAIMIRLDLGAAPAFRILVAREHGEFVWTAVIRAGSDLGLVPVGAVAHARLMEP
jgi:heterotetrameric sarcosine oxidase gamma subunit